MNPSYKLVLVLCVILVDQASKMFVQKYVPSLVVLNQKGVWGILPAWAGLVGVIAFGVWVLRQKNASWVLWAIVAAGLSNLIDRLVYNGVIDWIHTFAWFPVFNIADMVITSGVGILIILELKKSKK